MEMVAAVAAAVVAVAAACKMVKSIAHFVVNGATRAK